MKLKHECRATSLIELISDVCKVDLRLVQNQTRVLRYLRLRIDILFCHQYVIESRAEIRNKRKTPVVYPQVTRPIARHQQLCRSHIYVSLRQS